MEFDHEQILHKVENLEKKIDDIWISVEKTRKYFLIIIWVSVIAFVLPLIGMIFVIPQFLNTYLGSLNGML